MISELFFGSLAMLLLYRALQRLYSKPPPPDLMELCPLDPLDTDYLDDVYFKSIDLKPAPVEQSINGRIILPAKDTCSSCNNSPRHFTRL